MNRIRTVFLLNWHLSWHLGEKTNHQGREAKDLSPCFYYGSLAGRCGHWEERIEIISKP
jgi:hypothetical protein